MTTKKLSPKQARWEKELARFDFEVENKPGPENAADSPSRRPDYAQALVVGEQQALRDAVLPTPTKASNLNSPEVQGSKR